MSHAQRAPNPSDPGRRPAEIQGLVDGGTDIWLNGWARNLADPAERLSIDLRAGEETVHSVTADRERPDLVKAGMGDGRYAFEIPLHPGWTKRYAELAVVARAADGTEVVLPLRIRRPDIDPTGNLARQMEATGALHRRILEEIRLVGRRAEEIDAAREQTIQQLAERLEVMTMWMTRLDARLAEMPAREAPPPAAPRADGWQRLLVLVLLAIIAAAAVGTFLLSRG